MEWDFARKVTPAEFQELLERAVRQLQDEYPAPKDPRLSSFAIDAPYIHFCLGGHLVRDETAFQAFRRELDPGNDAWRFVLDTRERMLRLHAERQRGLG
ncbi:MAG TPA: hypothetical protein VHN99_05630 [Deinococcales bacterium]|nr:hypothetical protein [Deinococcales bacterium]